LAGKAQNSHKVIVSGPIFIGVAGWSIPKQHSRRFESKGSRLKRYAGRLNCVEINSSFYRSHRPKTYARWAASVPVEFRFSVKVPREITHLRRLKDSAEPLERFLSEVQALGDKLGPLLVQLPPRLSYEAGVADEFVAGLRQRFAGQIVCEPRHPTWFTAAVEALLRKWRVARVVADPPVAPTAAAPGGWNRLSYFRLHGSPQMYYSAYGEEYLIDLGARLRAAATAGPSWCIFDNTALGHATAHALALTAIIARQ
jgi:uncharacterized protein YecE (DUF72 family)